MDNNDIKVLEKIGLQEVCKKTHIEVKQLEFMINRQYDKLNKINTIGFVKILSREYKLDLTDWLEGFYDYWADHNEEDAGKDKIFVRANSDRSSKKAAWLFLLLCLIAGIFTVASIFKEQIHFDINGLLGKIKSVDSNQSSGTFQSPPVVQEAASSLGVKVEERILESNSSNSSVQAVVVKIDENLSRKTETNDTNTMSTAPLPNVPESNVTLVNVAKTNAIIAPTKRIWIGFINLENMNRKESTNDQNITVDLTKRQLIKTGNGFFKLSYDGSIEDFTEQGSTRFLVENGEIKKISEEKFIELNKGKNW